MRPPQRIRTNYLPHFYFKTFWGWFWYPKLLVDVWKLLNFRYPTWMVDFYGKYMESMGRFFCIPTIDTTKRKHKIHAVPTVDNRAEVNLKKKTCQKTSTVSITFPSSSWCILKKKKWSSTPDKKNRWPMAMFLKFAKSPKASRNPRPKSFQAQAASGPMNHRITVMIKHPLSIMGWIP